MRPATLLDSGPLVALLDRTEREHDRIAKLVAGLEAPFLTVEPVLTEACFLLRRVKHGAPTVLRLVRDGLVSIALSISVEAAAIEALMRKYSTVPMSLADACLVRLAERYRRSAVLTLDSHFEIYRAHGRHRLEVLGLQSGASL